MQGHALRPTIENRYFAGRLEEATRLAYSLEEWFGRRTFPFGVCALQDRRVRLAVTLGHIGQHLVPHGLLRQPDGLLGAFLGLTPPRFSQGRDFAPNGRLALHPAASSFFRHPGPS
jgi:hypothetical protein